MLRSPRFAALAAVTIATALLGVEWLFESGWEGGRRPGVLLAVGWLAICIAFALAVPASRDRDGEPLAHGRGSTSAEPRRALLLAAVILFAVGLATAVTNIRAWALAPIWLASIALWVGAWLSRPALPRLSRSQWALLGGVLILAATLRLYGLESHQASHIDEYVTPELALRRATVDVENGFPLFDMRSADIGSMLLLSAYPRRLAFETLGLSLTVHRLPSALVGILQVALVFFVTRALFGFRAGIIAALVLSTLAMHLAFSRHGEITIEGSFVWLLTAYCFARAFAAREPKWLALGGLALSLGMYLYLAGRPAFAFAAVVLVLAAFDPRLRGRWLAVGSCWFAIGLAIGLGPLLVTLAREPTVFAYNARLTSWLGEAIGLYQRSGEIGALRPLWEHAYRAFLAYNVIPSADHHYLPERGLFTTIPAALLYGTLALVSLRLLDWRYRLVALWFWAPTVALSFLSDHPPPVHRIQPAVVAAVVLIGLGFDRFVAIWNQRARWLSVVAGFALAGGLIASAVTEATFYYLDYARRDPDAYQGAIARYVAALPEGERLVVMPGPEGARLALAFGSEMERKNPTRMMYRPIQELIEPVPGAHRTTFAFNASMRAWFPVARAAFPAIEPRELVTSDPAFESPLLWTVFSVAEEDLARHRGLELSLEGADGRRWMMRTAAIEPPAGWPPDLAFPARLRWQGWYVPDDRRTESDSLVLTSSAPVALWLGDRAHELDLGRPPVEISSLRRAVPLRAEADVASAATAPTVRSTATGVTGSRPFPEDRANVWPGPPRVLIEYRGGDGQQLLAREFDAMFGDHSIGEGVPLSAERPVLIRLLGTLKIERVGLYEFELQSDQPARMLIDGRQVWPAYADWTRPRELRREEILALTRLNAGEHEIVVERFHRVGGQLNLLWRPPGEDQRLLALESLVPLSSWP